MRLDLPEDSYVWQINYGRCIFCGRCEEVCPTNALTLTAEFELAVMSKDDLLETARYNLQNCALCNRPYAPVKEITYLKDLLTSTGMDDVEVARARELLDICPACRRVAEGDNVKRISDQMDRRA
jgi:hydrogenase-4 component H